MDCLAIVNMRVETQPCLGTTAKVDVAVVMLPFRIVMVQRRPHDG